MRIFDSSLGAKHRRKLITCFCCICCNPANGRLDFLDGKLVSTRIWLFKVQRKANIKAWICHLLAKGKGRA
jgi:hypothetical protein